MTKLITTALLLMTLYSEAQDCMVEIEALKGKYEGECKKGKANGKGMAIGTDSYEGEFRNGYPDGAGKYTWKNGNCYEGTWKKGEIDGQGTMHYSLITGGDSTVTGFWKKGQYVGKYKNLYSVYSRSHSVSNITFKKNKDNTNEVTIHSKYGSNSSVPIGAWGDMEIINGSFALKESIDDVPGLRIIRYRAVVFPFRVKITYAINQVLEFEIFEAGNWTTEIELKIPQFIK